MFILGDTHVVPAALQSKNGVCLWKVKLKNVNGRHHIEIPSS